MHSLVLHSPEILKREKGDFSSPSPFAFSKLNSSTCFDGFQSCRTHDQSVPLIITNSHDLRLIIVIDVCSDLYCQTSPSRNFRNNTVHESLRKYTGKMQTCIVLELNGLQPLMIERIACLIRENLTLAILTHRTLLVRRRDIHQHRLKRHLPLTLFNNLKKALSIYFSHSWLVL